MVASPEPPSRTVAAPRAAAGEQRTGENVAEPHGSNEESDERATRKRGWRLMRAAVRPYLKLVLLGIGAGLLWAAARVAIPSLAGAAIDSGITHGNWSVAMAWTGAILGVGLVQAVMTGLRRYAAFGLALRVETDLRMNLVAHLQRLHFAFHDQAQTGRLMAHANTDVQQINNVVILIQIGRAHV